MSRSVRGATLVAVLLLASVGVPRPSQGSSPEPNDPMFHLQPELARIGVLDAWPRSTGTGVKVAVIGLSGVLEDHEDLHGKVLPGFDQIPDVPYPHGGHDTGAAGIVAAWTNNGVGIASVAPDALILPVRFRDDHAEAIRWATTQGAQVLLFETGAIAGWGDFVGVGRVLGPLWESVIGPGGKSDEDRAIEEAWEAGAVLLGGAGNYGFPACASPNEHPLVLCVGAVDDGGQLRYAHEFEGERSLYSNFGFGVDVMAPGEGVAPSYDLTRPDRRDLYQRFSGTSAAVAYAAGVAALLVGAGADNEEVVRLLKCTADDLGDPGPDPIYGYGRINALRALEALGTGITCPDQPRQVYDLLPQP